MTIVSTAEPPWDAGPPDWWLRYHGVGRHANVADPADRVMVPSSVLHRTDKAIQVRTRSGDAWMPLSQVTEVEGGVSIPRWLARKHWLDNEKPPLT